MRNIVVFILLMIASVAFAQNDRDYIRSGNRLYRNKSFDKAEVEYRKAVSANAENPQAVYNLGCSMMMQQKDSVAIQYFERASKLETNKLRRAKSNHNIGVILQNHKMYDKAIEAYKQALRDNPNDDETRYNLALCKKLLKNNPDNNKQNKNQDKDKNQDKNKEENKDNDKDKDKNKDKKDQQNPPPQEQMSKDNAEQLLNAAMQNEKQTQQRLQKAMQQPRKTRSQKNW
ncbi:MAG: tetratricopeptide repeat protein [Prevotella sp.]|jgi:Ca-activated chloride channel family protein|nr:tetratricopeptide repeat protein [Prevotella sp.]MBR6139026.1 tetratricopeptide repeat protein [Prevotella sp.]MDO4980677.1 tetratricopeptide repeat protein [Prevotellaceae bacterium]